MERSWLIYFRSLAFPSMLLKRETKFQTAVKFFLLITFVWIFAMPVNPWLRLTYFHRLVLWSTYNIVAGGLYELTSWLLARKPNAGMVLKRLPFSYSPFLIAQLVYPIFFFLLPPNGIIGYWGITFLWIIILQMVILMSITGTEKRIFHLVFIALVVLFVQTASLMSCYLVYRALLYWMVVY